MRKSGLVMRIAASVAAGIIAATILARPAAAVWECECNLCFTSDGNCDYVTHHNNCTETSGGCRSSECGPNETCPLE